MRGERRINIFVGLFIIIIAVSGIVFLLFQLFDDPSADSGNKTALNTPAENNKITVTFNMNNMAVSSGGHKTYKWGLQFRI
jgi:hypothetical protein